MSTRNRLRRGIVLLLRDGSNELPFVHIDIPGSFVNFLHFSTPRVSPMLRKLDILHNGT